MIREEKQRLEHTCRHPRPKSPEEFDKNRMKRIEANDPVAIRDVGLECYYEGDYNTAFEYWTKAAGLGDADAHYELSVMYGEGECVEKDEKKTVHHLEQAALLVIPMLDTLLGVMRVKVVG